MVPIHKCSLKGDSFLQVKAEGMKAALLLQGFKATLQGTKDRQAVLLRDFIPLCLPKLFTSLPPTIVHERPSVPQYNWPSPGPLC